MAIFHGKLANIYWDSDGVDTELEHGQNWSADIIHDTAEISAMQDTWKTFIGGYKSITATVECLMTLGESNIPLDTDGTPEGLSGDAAHLELFLYQSGTVYKGIFGDAVVTDITFSSDVNGIPTVSYSFLGVKTAGWANWTWHSSATVRPTA